MPIEQLTRPDDQLESAFLESTPPCQVAWRYFGEEPLESCDNPSICRAHLECRCAEAILFICREHKLELDCGNMRCTLCQAVVRGWLVLWDYYTSGPGSAQTLSVGLVSSASTGTLLRSYLHRPVYYKLYRGPTSNVECPAGSTTSQHSRSCLAHTLHSTLY
jgi:hypothetical protein